MDSIGHIIDELNTSKNIRLKLVKVLNEDVKKMSWVNTILSVVKQGYNIPFEEIRLDNKLNIKMAIIKFNGSVVFLSGDDFKFELTPYYREIDGRKIML